MTRVADSDKTIESVQQPRFTKVGRDKTIESEAAAEKKMRPSLQRQAVYRAKSELALFKKKVG